MRCCTAFLVCCMVTSWAPGSAQDLATPVAKVTQMLEDMKVKSDALKAEADATYVKVKATCDSTIATKKAEVESLGTNIESLNAQVLQLKTDIEAMVTSISNDQASFEMDSKELTEARKTRLSEEAAYQRDLQEYTVALSAVQRAITIMSKHGAAASFLQGSQSRMAQAALNEVRHSIRQLSTYTPEAGGLAKDEAIFDEFSTIKSSSSGYKSTAGGGVTSVLTGLQSTFSKAKDELMTKETEAKTAYTAIESNMNAQLETTRAALSTNKGVKAQKQESQTNKEGELNLETLNLASTTSFLNKTEVVCAAKAKSYEEMTALRTQEAQALEKAIAIIKGTVTTNSASLNDAVGSAFAQLGSRGRPNVAIAQGVVKHLDDFISKQAGKLHSESLVLLGKRMEVLATQAPSDALAKVKEMIQALVTKMQQDSAADATQNAWCNDELAKNDKETKSATANIEAHTAAIKKASSDVKMLEQEIIIVNATMSSEKQRKEEMIADRAEEKKENNETVHTATESVVAVEAAITILTEYYANASKQTALLQHKVRLSKLRNTTNTTSNEMAPELTAADTAGPQQDEGGNVVAMLEVVRDSYQTLIVKTVAEEEKSERLYNEELTDLLVMIATAEKESVYKAKLVVEGNATEITKTADLKASNVALTDAETNYENLKAPCLNGNAAEDRKQQVEAEIAALKEALTMLEAYDGTFLLQSRGRQARSARSAVRKLEAAVRDRLSNKQVPAEDSQLTKVAELLAGIKKDVEADLASDTAAFNDMITWCGATIGETLAALKVQNERDAELVTAIEVSAQQKTILETQLKALLGEVYKNAESLDQMKQLRSNDLASFRKEEKETMMAIASLRSAINLLTAKYSEFDKKDARNYTAEQEAVKASSSLIHMADNVAKALKLLPLAQFNSAISGETGAVLQGFLSHPQDFVGHRSKHAGLTQTGAEVNAGDGRQILGILEQLMETFTADLAAMQGKETSGISTFSSTKTAKLSQIAAMESSVSTKEGQLAHYTTMNAQAKEDLAYLRETNINDAAYLQQVRDGCATTEAEYKIRKTTRDDEIAALAEGISILTAGSGTTSSSSSSSTPVVKSMLVHSVKRVTRVFKSHRDTQKKRAVLKLKVDAPKASNKIVPKTAKAVAKAVAVKTSVKAVPKSLLQLVSVDSPLRKSLAALESQVRMAHSRLSVGPLTNSAIKTVLTQIDVVVVQLQTEKKLEVKKQETCVLEKNQATEQRQRRITDQAKLNNTIITLTGVIKSATDDLAELEKQIQELNTTMTEAIKTRNESHTVYKGSVQEQLDQQKKLHGAIAALKAFYAEKAAKAKATSFLQVQQTPQATLPSLLHALEQQLGVAGMQVTEEHTEAKGELAKQTAQYDAWAHDPNIKTICETGFNAGHSALRFLAQSKASLYEFDSGTHPYGKVAAAFLAGQFPGRIHNLWGDSTVVLPVFAWQRPDVRCDLMVVDGGKTYNVSIRDLRNFAKMASPKNIVAIDDAPCTSEVCAGPTQAWQELVKAGCIEQTKSVAMGSSRGFSVGRFVPCSAFSSDATAAQPVGQLLEPGPVIVPAVALSASKLVTRRNDTLNQTDAQKALDAGVESNMNTSWKTVKNVSATRTTKPKGFAQPLKSHGGGKGIIGILEIILQESEALISQDVKDEQSEVDLHLANLANTKTSVATKEKEIIMLETVKSDNELLKTQTEAQEAAVQKEITEIDEFILIVDTQCSTFLLNFATNQEARATEISDTIQAKEVLAGMSEDTSSTLLQLAHTLHRASHIN